MLNQKILIMGLPGAGKTYFAKHLKYYLENNGFPLSSAIGSESVYSVNQKAKVEWFNADLVRSKYNDWDFSTEGRLRQSLRMAEFAVTNKADFIICDFVAPLEQMRKNFDADWTIWIDTVEHSKYQDTDKIFQPPKTYDFRIPDYNIDFWINFVGEHIIYNKRRPVFNSKKDTVQMLGRWQPWHKGHRALFERLLQKTGQVVIEVRDMELSDNNPFTFSQIVNFIKKDLDPLYQGTYEIVLVPNIVHIGWGREVGYTAGQEDFSKEITDISATKIRTTYFNEIGE